MINDNDNDNETLFVTYTVEHYDRVQITQMRMSRLPCEETSHMGGGFKCRGIAHLCKGHCPLGKRISLVARACPRHPELCKSVHSM